MGYREFYRFHTLEMGHSLCNAYFRPFLMAGLVSASCCCALARPVLSSIAGPVVS